MQVWTPPTHCVFMSHSLGSTATNTLFGTLFLTLDRLQQLPPGDGEGIVEAVAMTDPAAVECVLRHWTLGDSYTLQKLTNVSSPY
jgi:hypothetical protein